MLALLIVAATPVSLNLELSRDTAARIGPRVREAIEERLGEEGFEVEPGAKLKLGVEELHGTLRLWVKVGARESSSELRLGEEWAAERGLEIAQRLAVLAHEGEAWLPAPAVIVPENDTPKEEEVNSPSPRPSPPLAGEREKGVGAGVRLGIVMRPPSVDPSLSFHGSIPGVVEPVVLVGLVIAPAPGLTAWEVPFAGGLRVPIALSQWTLTPELLGGGRLHLFDGGVRLDPIGLLGLSLLRSVGALKVGVRVGLEVSTPREHLLGDELLWSRGGFAFSAGLQLER